MRWRVNEEWVPKQGDRRDRLVFAWKKTRVEGWWVWLEHYYVTEKYYEPASGMPGWWSEEKKSLATWV